MSTLTSFINRYFGLEKKQSNIKTEVIAGLTTFVAMAYVIFVNPAIISQFQPNTAADSRHHSER